MLRTLAEDKGLQSLIASADSPLPRVCFLIGGAVVEGELLSAAAYAQVLEQEGKVSTSFNGDFYQVLRSYARAVASDTERFFHLKEATITMGKTVRNVASMRGSLDAVDAYWLVPRLTDDKR